MALGKGELRHGHCQRRVRLQRTGHGAAKGIRDTRLRVRARAEAGGGVQEVQGHQKGVFVSITTTPDEKFEDANLKKNKN